MSKENLEIQKDKPPVNNFEGSNMYFQAKSHRRYSPYKSQFYQSEQTNPVDQQNIVGRILINYRTRSYLI